MEQESIFIDQGFQGCDNNQDDNLAMRWHRGRAFSAMNLPRISALLLIPREASHIQRWNKLLKAWR